jgi:hypothetical protein
MIKMRVGGYNAEFAFFIVQETGGKGKVVL